MRFAATGLAVLLLPSLAAADPQFTIGATFGEAQSEWEAAQHQGPDETYGVFARLHLWRFISAQLEVSRIESDPRYDVLDVTVLGVFDLGPGSVSRALAGRFVPIVVAGVGGVTSSGGASGTDALVGLGIEYRSVHGVVVGVEGQIGNRSSPVPEYSTTSACPQPCGPLSFEYDGMWNGQFRSVLVTGGIAF